MAATETGVWNLQEVRDKQLASEWTYTDPTIFSLYEWGSNSYGQLGQNQASAQLTGASSPVQIPGTDGVASDCGYPACAAIQSW